MLCFVVTFHAVLVSGQCDPKLGPAGKTECAKTPSDDYEWRTCLSNKYIEYSSGGKDSCADTNATYCWYSCSKEFLNGGNDCNCTKGAKQVPASLPGTCYNSEDSSCSWYEDCLQKKHPTCGSSTLAFLVASKFCRLQENQQYSFSPLARKWINETRRCSQTTTWIPMIRSWSTKGCEGKENFSFKQEQLCYLGPLSSNLKTTSICDLSLSDWWRVFWSMESDLGLVSKVASYSFGSAMIRTTQLNCENQPLSHNGDNLRFIEIKLKPMSNNSREVHEINFNKNFISLLTDIASQTNWNGNEKLGWYAYGGYVNEVNSTILASANILFFDKSSLKNDVPLSNKFLNDTVKQFMKDVNNGEITINNKELKKMFQIHSVSWCDSQTCQQSLQRVKANKHKESTKSNGEGSMKFKSWSLYICFFIFTAVSTKLFL